jgi:hypothetical protein
MMQVRAARLCGGLALWLCCASAETGAAHCKAVNHICSVACEPCLKCRDAATVEWQAH